MTVASICVCRPFNEDKNTHSHIRSDERSSSMHRQKKERPVMISMGVESKRPKARE